MEKKILLSIILSTLCSTASSEGIVGYAIQDHALENYLRSAPEVDPPNCPWTSIITISASQDLATQIWEYSTVYSIARYTGLDPFVPPLIHKKLSLVFKGLTVPSFASIVNCQFQPENFVYNYADWTNMDKSIFLAKNAIELPLVLKYLDALIDQFELTNDFKKAGKTAIERSLRYYPSDTVVGIYITKSDFEYLSLIPEAMAYYSKAIDYFREEYGNATFIAMCGSSPICTDKFFDLDDVYVYKHDNIERLDIAILSMCDHVIFRNSGIGIWGGLLAGGKTAYNYCGEFIVNGHGDETMVRNLIGTKQECPEKT